MSREKIAGRSHGKRRKKLKVDCNWFPFTPKEIRLFHSRKKFVDWCNKRFGTTPILKGSEAQTVTFGDTAAVLMEASGEDVWECALLCHEAYHVVCGYLEGIGEKSAGEEIVAYMVQCVSGALMDAHMRWKEKRCQ